MRGCICPWPTSMAVTWAAPRSSSTSVKPHRRSADVETVVARRIEMEMIERRNELERGTGDVILRRIIDLDFDVLGKESARLCHDSAADLHCATADGIACPRAAGKKAEAHEKLVEALGILIGHRLCMTGKSAACKPFVAVAADEMRAFEEMRRAWKQFLSQILDRTD